MPKRWKGFTVRRKFRGVSYTIVVRNPRGRCKGVSSLVVDGRRVEGNLVPIAADGRTEVRVEATLGS
jgi:cellobiose phosphorylase